MRQTFILDDVLADITNNAYPQLCEVINESIPEQPIQVMGPLLGIYNNFTKEVAEKLLSTYKEHLLNTYPELKKYKL